MYTAPSAARLYVLPAASRTACSGTPAVFEPVATVVCEARKVAVCAARLGCQPNHMASSRAKSEPEA